MRPARCCAMKTTAKSPPSSRARPMRARAPICPRGSAAQLRSGARTCPAKAASMASITRCSISALSLLLALGLSACGGAGGEARVLGATVTAAPNPALEVRTALRFTPAMLAALEQGIPLTLRFELAQRGGAAPLDLTRQWGLGYSPLAGRYR